MLKRNYLLQSLTFYFQKERKCWKIWKKNIQNQNRSTYQTLPDRTKQLRPWFVHSNNKNPTFCSHRLILGPPEITRNASVFAREWYADWHNVSPDIKIHETSAYHQESGISVIRCYARKSRVDKKVTAVQNYLVRHNRAVVSAVIDCIHCLSQEMMVFRNSDSNKRKIDKFISIARLKQNRCSSLLEKFGKASHWKKTITCEFFSLWQFGEFSFYNERRGNTENLWKNQRSKIFFYYSQFYTRLR